MEESPKWEGQIQPPPGIDSVNPIRPGVLKAHYTLGECFSVHFFSFQSLNLG